MVLDVKDFETLADSALKLFDERLANYGCDIRGLDIEVARLESQVIQLYAIAALLARREDDLDKVAEIWNAVTSVCDAVANRIQALSTDHPFCVASHDRILDIRNKAARLCTLHC